MAVLFCLRTVKRYRTKRGRVRPTREDEIQPHCCIWPLDPDVAKGIVLTWAWQASAWRLNILWESMHTDSTLSQADNEI